MNTSTKIGDEIRYDDIDAIKGALVGHRIVSKATVRPDGLAGYGHGEDAVEYTLDDGTRLYAIDADGGCACSNGCFPVYPAETLPENVITNVEQVEVKDEGEYDTSIRLFVYSEGVKSELFHSKGDDNGYYGWGHHIVINRPVGSTPEGQKDA